MYINFILNKLDAIKRVYTIIIFVNNYCFETKFKLYYAIFFLCVCVLLALTAVLYFGDVIPYKYFNLDAVNHFVCCC